MPSLTTSSRDRYLYGTRLLGSSEMNNFQRAKGSLASFLRAKSLISTGFQGGKILATDVASRMDLGFARSAVEALREKIASCPGGDDAPVCSTTAALQGQLDVVENVLGICDFTGSGVPVVERFCHQSTGVDDASAFDFIDDPDHLVTFGGTASVSMEYTIRQSGTLSQETKYNTEFTYDVDDSSEYCLAVARRLRAMNSSSQSPDDHHRRRRLEEEGDKAETSDVKGGNGPSCRRKRRRLAEFGYQRDTSTAGAMTVNLGRLASRDRAKDETISFTLGDPDPMDLFAVAIRTDPIFGTPIFDTMGGLSENPGEMLTSKADSGITIIKLLYYCPERRQDDPSVNPCRNLENGTSSITVGIVVRNMSPWKFDDIDKTSWNSRYYRLFATTNTTRSDYDDSKKKLGCGVTVRHISGVSLLEPGMLVQLPTGQSQIVAVIPPFPPPLTVCAPEMTIEFTLVADTEYNTPTYQYRTALDEETKDVSILHPVWDHDKGQWIPDTLPHFPARYSPSDSVSSQKFTITWKSPDTTTTSLFSTSSSPSSSPWSSVGMILVATAVGVILGAAVGPQRFFKTHRPRLLAGFKNHLRPSSFAYKYHVVGRDDIHNDDDDDLGQTYGSVDPSSTTKSTV